MARLDVKTQDPERYAQVKAEQEELKLQELFLAQIQNLQEK